MIVTCPNCATRYQIEPDALVPNGRYLRCVKCSHQWLERPSAAGGAEAPEEDNFDDLLSPPRRTRRPPARRPGARGRTPPKRSRLAKIVPWAALAAVLVVILGGIVLLQKPIVSIFPPAAPLYAMLGLGEPAPVQRFEVRNVITEQRRDGDNVVIEVKGEVHNLTNEVQSLPQLIAVLRDVNEREIQFWKFNGPVPELQPGQTTEFTTSITNPPANARSLIVNFAAPDPPPAGG